MSDQVPGVPPLLSPIPDPGIVADIVTLPGVNSLLNVPSISALQQVPNVTDILNVPNAGSIPDLPNIGNMLNLPSMSALIRVENIGNILRLPGRVTADQISTTQYGAPQWGIFLGGMSVITVDSVATLEFKQDWRVADYPMEDGAFESYNKVTTPFDVRVQLTRGGDEADRQLFLQQLEDIGASLDLYDVVTPEHVYEMVNVVRYSLRRTARNGVSLITADVWLLEIRETVIPVYTSAYTVPAGIKPLTNTAAPSGRTPKQDGQRLPQKPTPAQTAPVEKIIPPKPLSFNQLQLFSPSQFGLSWAGH